MKYHKIIAALLGVSLLAGQPFLTYAQTGSETIAAAQAASAAAWETGREETASERDEADRDPEMDDTARNPETAAAAQGTNEPEELAADSGQEMSTEVTGTEEVAESVESAEETDENFRPDEEDQISLRQGVEAAIVTGTREAESGPADVTSALGTSGQAFSRTEITSSAAWQQRENLIALIRETADRCGEEIDLAAFGLMAVDADGAFTADWEALKEVFWEAANEEYFFLTGNYACLYDKASGQIRSIRLGQTRAGSRIINGYLSDYRREDGSPDAEKIRRDRETLEEAAGRALAAASQADSVLGQVLLLHDYIVAGADYDQASYLESIRGGAAVPSLDYTAYGALVNRTAVCNGYALAYSLIAARLGIPAYVIASDALDHAWNMVQIDGAWYNLDTTRDDCLFMRGKTYFGAENEDYADLGYVGHTYFLQSDQELADKYGGSFDSYIQCSSLEKPASLSSAPFSNEYLFRALEDASYSYDAEAGCWYAFDLQSGSLYRAKSLETASAGVIWQDAQARYGFVSGGILYYNTEDGIYACRLEDGSRYQFDVLTPDEGQITEMVLRDGMLTYVVAGMDGSQEYTVRIADLKASLLDREEDSKPEEEGVSDNEDTDDGQDPAGQDTDPALPEDPAGRDAAAASRDAWEIVPAAPAAAREELARGKLLEEDLGPLSGQKQASPADMGPAQDTGVSLLDCAAYGIAAVSRDLLGR